MTRALLLTLLVLVGGSAWGQDDHGQTPAGAVALDAGGVSGRIETGGDLDLFRLEAVAGRTYVVETGSLSGGMDTLLDLYGVNGQHMSRDDDGAGNLASKIEFRASQTGNYWVMVSHYDRSAGTGGYTVRARAAGTPTTTAPGPTPATPTTPAAPAPSASAGVSLDFPRVFDPKLSGAALDVEFVLASAGSIRLEVKDGAGRLVRQLLSGQRSAGRHLASWDGTASGLFVAPGTYSVELSSGGQRLATSPLSIVRLGIRSVGFGGSGKVSLTYHDADGFGSRIPLDQIGPAWTLPASALGAGCLDASSGAPLSLPARHTGLTAPPRTSSGTLASRGISLPLAYTLGSQPQAQLQFGDSAASNGSQVGCGYPIAGVPLRVAVEGGASVASMSGELQPGGTTTLDLPAAPGSVGKTTARYRFRFYYLAGNAWAPVPGGQTTEHTLYATFARPASADMPGRRPWVKALDLAASWAAGQTTRRGAMTKVVEGVNSSLGLRYDVNAGAPAYTGGWELHRPELDFDAFLDDLDNGRTVNCLDCASLVTKVASQLGLSTQVAILGYDFRLYFLRGIGYSSFTSSLFGGHHAFSYHAVATTDRGSTIDDACLHLDDDARPWSSPFTDRLPTGIALDRYRQQLSPDMFRLRDLGTASLR